MRSRHRVELLIAVALAAAWAASCDWDEGLKSGGPAPDAGDDVLTATFIDVGQGDAALLELPGGEAVLIDGGDDGYGESAILPLLEEKGVAHLDLVVLTHPHADHCGGLDEVIARVTVGEIWENGETADTLAWQRYEEARDASGAQVLVPAQGHAVRYGDASLEVLSRPAGHEGENDDSIVVMVRHGGIAILMAGDAEQLEQQDLISDHGAALDCDVLKVPHHGSRYFAPAFPEHTSPDLAVISCGEGNDYGHPHQEALAAYEEAGAAICRTDLLGDVVVTTDGEGLSSSCQ